MLFYFMQIKGNIPQYAKELAIKNYHTLDVYKRLFEELFQLSSANTGDSEPQRAITRAVTIKITLISF